MNLRYETQEFFQKAKELGLVAEIDEQLEERKHAQRLQVIAKIKQLPTEAQTELPALSKAAATAHKELQLAEEAYRAADRRYKDLSLRVYGAQLQFDGARATLEREAKSLAPSFLREAWEDLRMLDGMVSERFHYEVKTVAGSFFGRHTVTTSNGEQVQTCHSSIKKAQERIEAMMLESTDRDKARSEVHLLLDTVAKEAFALGVPEKTWAARRAPVDVAARAEDHIAKQGGKRRAQIASISA